MPVTEPTNGNCPTYLTVNVDIVHAHTPYHIAAEYPFTRAHILFERLHEVDHEVVDRMAKLKSGALKLYLFLFI